MTGTKRGIKSIEVGGRILNELIRSSASMKLKDLACATDLTPAQTHAYLTSYRASGMVEQDPQTGLYRIGPFAIRLGNARIQHAPILTQTRAIVDRLASELGLMVAMIVLGPQGPTVVYIQQGDTSLEINIHPGTTFSVVGTASGQVFAAFSEDEKVKKLVSDEFKKRNQTIAMSSKFTKEEFARKIKIIRQQGYAYVEGMPIPSINGVTAPVFDAENTLAAAVTLIGAESDLAVGSDSQAVQRLKETVQLVACCEPQI